MGVKITEVGIVVPGKITRKYDEASDETTLVFSDRQAREARESLDTVVELFDGQTPVQPQIGPPQ